ncbi:RNA recognition motif domain-containing protein [Aquabacterium sp.]|uniref:RNA recognition motif domain-containing protein n=1 Tax=Aquabacterium sp. TaxID=1872578 RepID=UPI0040381350
MGNKLYVGNLAYSVRDQDLQDAFSQYGAVSSAKVMMDRETGRSKGFGFVEMSNDAEAQAAINGLNGQPVAGRAVVVNEARPREERPAGFRSPYGGGNSGGGNGGGGFGGGRREGGGGGYGGGGGGGRREGGGGGYGGGGYGGGGRREGGGGYGGGRGGDGGGYGGGY